MEGIIVRTYPYGDADLILRVFTAKGEKISCLAKHARKSTKRFGSTIDVFDLGRIEVAKGRGTLWMLKSFVQVTSFPGLRTNLDRMGVAALACESFDYLIPDDSSGNQDLYTTLKLGLKAIEESMDMRETLKAGYLVLATLLRDTGFRESIVEEKPSAKNLLLLIESVERVAERELASKDTVISILKELKRNLTAKQVSS